jgi:ribose-phosphate pyrophosphokinase
MTGLKIFSGNSNSVLAKKVAQAAGVDLGFCAVTTFADGEIQAEIHESVRGQNVFVIQSTCPPVNQNYMELFIILDALKRASAAQITAVIPYYGYARQDRKVAPRAPISAKCMADLITTAGQIELLLSICMLLKYKAFLMYPWITFLPFQPLPGPGVKLLEMGVIS